MTRRVWIVAAVAAVTLVAPAAASAHAYLVKTDPPASVTLSSPPRSVALTFDEAVEPRFAIVSVSDAAGNQVTAGRPARSPANPDTLVVPLKRIGEGWYLVYWRAISVDGHPVQNAFTFAVGPNPGPPPQFTVPHISGSATSTSLLVARWVMFLTTLTAIGLFVLRALIAQPLVRRVEGTSLHAVSRAFAAVALLGLISIPVYLEESTAIDSLRSFWAVGSLVPLWRTTAFGRAYVDYLICFALFVAAALGALWVDRPRLEHRPVAALLALVGALAAAAAVLVIPGAGGHAGQTAPRGVAVFLDWLHLLAVGVWLGGLAGLLVLWGSLPRGLRLNGLAVCVPRFSNVAFVSVLAIIGTGVGASILHLPTVDALWLTSYGKVILIKVAILVAALAIAAVNLLRTKPRLVDRDASAVSLVRALVTGEVVLVAGAVFAGALLSSLAPPPPAFAKEGSAAAQVGPGVVAKTVNTGGYAARVLVNPNKAVAPNSFGIQLTHGGRPVTGADVTLAVNMLDMTMPQQEYQLEETSPGVYTRNAPALVMVGHWGLTFNVTPKHGPPFTLTVVDKAAG